MDAGDELDITGLISNGLGQGSYSIKVRVAWVESVDRVCYFLYNIL